MHTQTLTARKVDQRLVLISALDVLTYRALERAGNRNRRGGGRRGRCDSTIASHEVHVGKPVNVNDVDIMLRNAWDNLPIYVQMYGCCGVDTEVLEETMTSYVTWLLVTGRPHKLEYLAAKLIRSYEDVFGSIQTERV